MHLRYKVDEKQTTPGGHFVLSESIIHNITEYKSTQSFYVNFKYLTQREYVSSSLIPNEVLKIF